MSHRDRPAQRRDMRAFIPISRSERSDFVKVGFWLAGALRGRDGVRRDTDLSEIDISPEVRDRARTMQAGLPENRSYFAALAASQPERPAAAS